MTAGNCIEYLTALRALASDGRLLIAATVLEKVEAFLATAEEGEGAQGRAALAEEGMAALVAQLKKRVPECRQALRDLESVRECRLLWPWDRQR